jgi:hypothetical protein
MKSTSAGLPITDVRGNTTGFIGTNVMGNSLRYDPSGMLSNVTTPQSSTDYLYDGDDLIADYRGAGDVKSCQDWARGSWVGRSPKSPSPRPQLVLSLIFGKNYER